MPRLQDVRGKKWIVVGDRATLWERVRWMWRRRGMSRGEDNGCMMLIGGSLGASLRGLVDVEPVLRRVSFVLVGR